MKKYFAGIFLLHCLFSAYAQWEDGILMDIQEIHIGPMQAQKMPGAEAVMKVIEQYTDGQYRFAFVSNNYHIPPESQKYLHGGKDLFFVVVAGYPARNNLLYAQIFFDNSFFFVVMVKKDTDMKRLAGVQITRMNYEKGNAVRRNNVRDVIQRNNIIPLGIDAIGRY